MGRGGGWRGMNMSHTRHCRGRCIRYHQMERGGGGKGDVYLHTEPVLLCITLTYYHPMCVYNYGLAVVPLTSRAFLHLIIASIPPPSSLLATQVHCYQLKCTTLNFISSVKVIFHRLCIQGHTAGCDGDFRGPL